MKRRSDESWVSFEPTSADPWDLGKVAHLHRRAGFGAGLAELERDVAAGPEASIARLLKPPEPTAAANEALEGLRQGILNAADLNVERLKAYWLYRVVFGPDPLREKLTLFWHGHFATSNRKVQNVGWMLTQNELFRREALGSFPSLCRAILADPAILVWLDGVDSPKERPNENLAREFLELFTLGAGHYSEADIRAAARALTGWTCQGNKGDGTAPPRFDLTRFDDGTKTFLNRTGAWSADDIARITLEQSAAAAHLATKLYRCFVRDEGEPPAPLIDELADAIRRSPESLAGPVGLILGSRHFYSAGVRRRLIKSPVEFTAGLVRMLELPRSRVDLMGLASTCAQQGQNLFYPPNVKGWDGGRSWISSAALLARSNGVADLVWGNRTLGIEPFDPAEWASRHGIAPEAAVERLVDVLVQGDLTPEARALAIEAGSDGQPESLRKGIQLVLSCPEFHLA